MASTAHLLTFSRKQIVEAFEKAKVESFGINDGTLVLITKDMYESVKRFGRDNFVPFETLFTAIGYDKESPELELFWNPPLQLNMSLAIVNNDTKEIMGMFIIDIAKIEDEPDLSVFADDRMRAVLEVLVYVDEKGNIFKHYGVTELVAFKELAVGVAYRQRGIASYLVDTAVKFVKYLGVSPVCIRVEGTSNFSKRCKNFEKGGFEALYNVPFDEYPLYKIPDTGIHKSITLYGLYINK